MTWKLNIVLQYTTVAVHTRGSIHGKSGWFLYILDVRIKQTGTEKRGNKNPAKISGSAYPNIQPIQTTVHSCGSISKNLDLLTVIYIYIYIYIYILGVRTK